MAEPGKELITRDSLLPDRGTAEALLRQIAEFQALIRARLKDGIDYGVIPGTLKPTLLKPGAEKVVKLLGLLDTYEVITLEDWEKGFFYYRVTCTLQDIDDGRAVTQGLGSCNSKESRYAYRWLWPSELEGAGFEAVKQTLKTRQVKTKQGKVTQYRTSNEDIWSQVNTILKMAKKRALVDAALSVGRLSELFTQDIEDMGDGVIEGEVRVIEEEPEATRPPEAPKGECPIHHVPFVHRKGTSKKTGELYEFWACPKKDAKGDYCQERPPKELFEEVAEALGAVVPVVGEDTEAQPRAQARAQPQTPAQASPEDRATPLQQQTILKMASGVGWKKEELDKRLQELYGGSLSEITKAQATQVHDKLRKDGLI